MSAPKPLAAHPHFEHYLDIFQIFRGFVRDGAIELTEHHHSFCPVPDLRSPRKPLSGMDHLSAQIILHQPSRQEATDMPALELDIFHGAMKAYEVMFLVSYYAPFDGWSVECDRRNGNEYKAPFLNLLPEEHRQAKLWGRRIPLTEEGRALAIARRLVIHYRSL
jgi:hypothetical protein